MSRHCNFNVVSGKGTGTYCLITGFYWLTDMPAAFQKAMQDYTLAGLDNCILDDNKLRIQRRSNKFILQFFKKQDEDNLRLNLPK